jgi:hypothetical protein
MGELGVDGRIILKYISDKWKSRGSSVSIVTRLGAGRPEFDTRQELGFFLILHRFHTGSGAHPASYTMGTVGKAAGA